MSTEPAGAPPEIFRMKPYWQALGLIAAISLWPFVVAYIASAVADLNGCAIDPAGPTPCAPLGADRGQLLYDLGMQLESAYVFLGIGALLLLVWTSLLVISAMAFRRKRAGVADATRMRPNFLYYGLALAGIVAVTYATLQSWLPAPLLLLVLFAAIFWLASFIFALLSTLSDRAKAR